MAAKADRAWDKYIPYGRASLVPLSGGLRLLARNAVSGHSPPKFRVDFPALHTYIRAYHLPKPGSPPPNLGGKCPEPHFTLKGIVPPEEGIGIYLMACISLQACISQACISYRRAFLIGVHLLRACISQASIFTGGTMNNFTTICVQSYSAREFA
jgi:hypothetical protein